MNTFDKIIISQVKHGRASMERNRSTLRQTGECVKSSLTNIRCSSHITLSNYKTKHIKQERSGRSPIKDKIKIEKTSPYLCQRVRLSHGALSMYYKSYCHMQSIGLRCPYPHGTCDMCQMYPFP